MNNNQNNNLNKYLNENEQSAGRQQSQQGHYRQSQRQYTQQQYTQQQYQQQQYNQSRQTQPRKKSGFPKGLLILVLIGALVAGAVWGIPKLTASMEQSRLEEEARLIAESLAQGDALAAEGKTASAITAYKQAGEEGTEKIRQLHLAEAKELVESGKFAKAVTYLRNNTGGMFTEEEAYSQTVALARTHNEEILTKAQEILTKAGKSPSEVSQSETYMRNFREWTETGVPNETPGNKELQAELKISTGYVLMLRNSYCPNWETLKDCWQDSKKGSLEKIILYSAEILGEGKLEGIDNLRTFSENEDFITAMTSSFLPDMYHCNATDMNAYLEYYHVSRDVHYRTIKPAQTLSASYSSREKIRLGIAYHGPAMELSSGNIDLLKQVCGSNAKGKILILHSRQKFKDNDTTPFLCTELMDYLPAKYVAKTVEEAEYVIHLESTYANRGVYQNGCVRILETTKITLYSAVTGKQLYTAKETGELSDTMYYTGSVPSYYSHRSPDMTEHLQKITDLLAS